MTKMIEFFSGIGSQAQSWKNSNIYHEVVAISDWDINAIISYDALHTDDGLDYTNGISREDLIKHLDKFTFTSDGKKVCNISRIREKKLRMLYNAHKRSNNLGSILDIEKVPYADLWTYSFPCTDLSLSGKLGGMGRDSNTKSGLLWEIERLLKLQSEKPKYLIMENVKNLIKQFKSGFDEWLEILDELGYNTYYNIINSSDRNIPQNRERVFAFSVLKKIDHGFFMNDKIKLKYNFCDFLEDNPDENLYLSQDKVDKLIYKNGENIIGYIPRNDGKQHQSNTIYKSSGVAPTLCARDYKDPIKILIGASRGRYDKNGNIVQNLELNTTGKTNTLTTVQKDNYVVDAINHRIRKLSPLEYWRLMGFKDEQFYKASKVNSKSALIKQAGNSIVVDNLEYLWEQMVKYGYLSKI